MSEVGATLRRYDVDGRPVCWGFGEHEMATGARGQVLAPWPNRLEDGHYVHRGTVGQAPLDEPERKNAIHGLVRWLPWRVEQQSATSLRAACVIHAQPAYPFSVSVTVDYRLDPGGLAVQVAAESLGPTSAPFGVGFHNYLHAGPHGVDRCRLSVPARRQLVADDRLLPCGDAPVTGDLAALCGDEPGTIGGEVLDTCLTDLRAGSDGRWRARFVPSSGEADAVAVWADGRFGWATIYSGDTLEPDMRRIGLAVEPMTCPANALRSGDGLVVLEPGDRFAAGWGLSPARLSPS